MDSNTILLASATLVAGAIAPLLAYLKERKETKKKEAEIQTLKSENKEIREELQETKNAFPKDLEIMENVTDVLNNKLLPIINEYADQKKTIKIENFGLDLETVMPWINNTILQNTKLVGVRFEMKALIIDPDSAVTKTLIDGKSNISTATINASITAANSLVYQELFRFSFEMKKYELLPIIHGFLINDNHLFLGFTEIENGKLFGGKKSYIHLRNIEPMSNVSLHYFNFFNHWFNYYWDKSIEVANIKK